MAKSKPESVRIYLSTHEKITITRLASQEGKTVSEFVRALVLSKDDNKSGNFVGLEKGQYILTRLMLAVGSQGIGQEQILDFYHTCLKDAEEKFGRE